MGKGQQEKPQLATTMSQMFYLAHHLAKLKIEPGPPPKLDFGPRNAQVLITPGVNAVAGKVRPWDFKRDPTGGRRYLIVEFIEIDAVHERLWIKNTTKAAHMALAKIEGLNLLLGVWTVGEKVFDKNRDLSEIGWAGLGMVGSLSDARAAYGVFKGWEIKRLMKLGVLSAAIDMIFAGKETYKKYVEGDFSAMAGSVSVGAGSGLMLVGSAMVWAGKWSATSGVGLAVGLVGVVMVALGHIVALFTSDTDLQLFVKHCIWGERYDEDDGAKPWSAGSFQSWAKEGGLERQVQAMTNLLAGFKVTGEGPWKIRINFGMTHARTKVHVKLTSDFVKKYKAVMVEIDLASAQTLVMDANDPDRRQIGGVDFTFGYGFVEIEMDFRDKSLPATPSVSDVFKTVMDCEVRLDYFGDGTHWVPSSGKWVRYHTKLSNSDTVSSLGY